MDDNTRLNDINLVRDMLYQEIEKKLEMPIRSYIARMIGMGVTRFIGKLNRRSMYDVELLVIANVLDIDLNSLCKKIEPRNIFKKVPEE